MVKEAVSAERKSETFKLVVVALVIVPLVANRFVKIAVSEVRIVEKKLEDVAAVKVA